MADAQGNASEDASQSELFGVDADAKGATKKEMMKHPQDLVPVKRPVHPGAAACGAPRSVSASG